MRKYAIITNSVVSSIEELDDAQLLSRIKEVQMIMDVEDLTPTPAIGWVLNGNRLEIPQNLSDREAFERDLNRRKSVFGDSLSKNAIDMIGARNKILNKTGSQVTALLTSLLGIKALMETGALGTARSSCIQLKVVYTEYSDIFDYVINEITSFESKFGL